MSVSFSARWATAVRHTSARRSWTSAARRASDFLTAPSSPAALSSFSRPDTWSCAKPESMSVLDFFRLDGKTALITGARRGIGLAMAVALAEAGADIVATSTSLEATGSELQGNIESLGRRFHGYRCDLADRKAVYNLIESVKIECPRIDILVNNGGTVL